MLGLDRRPRLDGRRDLDPKTLGSRAVQIQRKIPLDFHQHRRWAVLISFPPPGISAQITAFAPVGGRCL